MVHPLKSRQRRITGCSERHSVSFAVEWALLFRDLGPLPLVLRSPAREHVSSVLRAGGVDDRRRVLIDIAKSGNPSAQDAVPFRRQPGDSDLATVTSVPLSLLEYGAPSASPKTAGPSVLLSSLGQEAVVGREEWWWWRWQRRGETYRARSLCYLLDGILLARKNTTHVDDEEYSGGIGVGGVVVGVVVGVGVGVQSNVNEILKKRKEGVVRGKRTYLYLGMGAHLCQGLVFSLLRSSSLARSMLLPISTVSTEHCTFAWNPWQCKPKVFAY